MPAGTLGPACSPPRGRGGGREGAKAAAERAGGTSPRLHRYPGGRAAAAAAAQEQEEKEGGGVEEEASLDEKQSRGPGDWPRESRGAGMEPWARHARRNSVGGGGGGGI